MFLQETTEEIEFRDQQEAYAILGDRDTLLQSMQENFSCRRTQERRVGKESELQCRSRWSP